MTGGTIFSVHAGVSTGGVGIIEGTRVELSKAGGTGEEVSWTTAEAQDCSASMKITMEMRMVTFDKFDHIASSSFWLS